MISLKSLRMQLQSASLMSVRFPHLERTRLRPFEHPPNPAVWARDLQRRGASPKTKGGYPSAKIPLKGGLRGGLKPPSPKA